MFGYFGVGFPLHKPYPYSLYRFSDSSIWMVPERFGELMTWISMRQPEVFVGYFQDGKLDHWEEKSAKVFGKHGTECDNIRWV